MSSIRPLATITVLAAAGVFLYMKINETEPVLPEEVAGLEFDSGLEFGSEFKAEPGSSTGTEQFTASTTAGGRAPEFTASTPAEVAPPFNPGAAVAAGQAPAFDPAVAATSPDGGTAAPFAAAPDLPPLPTIPSATAPAAETHSSHAMEDAHDNHSHAAAESTTSPVTTPTETLPMVRTPQQEVASEAQSSLFSATHIAVEAALDRGQLSQALLLLSDWYGDPSLSPQEAQEVEQLLSQLAGSVIYSTEHRLEPPYMVQAGERLQDIAARYEVPWQLLAKINGITSPDQLQTGQQLKVVRGPFSATIDLRQRQVTLMLNRRYAGRFAIDVDPTTTVEEGHWSVNQKLLTPGNVAQHLSAPVTPTEERSLILTNSAGGTNQLVIIRATHAATATDPTGRVIRLSSADVGDVYDILSLGSEVTIRR
ncbi:MAG: LysM peptidoglycan-binding domain-containing protein [Planctomycetes bacterium]|nr:LysM peptidoglycan-binding domain-containing protein [Planctomycetota bacterium]